MTDTRQPAATPPGRDRSARRGDPGRSRPGAWRTRRGRWLAAGCVAVVAASVAFDVGSGTTTADRAGDLRSFVSTLNADIASCNASLVDSLDAYLAVAGGAVHERGAAEEIVNGDEPNCTPVSNSALYDMDTTEAPATLRAYRAQAVVADLDTWSFPDAAAAITDLDQLLVHPGSTPVRADLRRRTRQLTGVDGSAQRILDVAASRLHTHVARLDLGSAGGLQAAGL